MTRVCLQTRRASGLPILCALGSDPLGRECDSHFTESREWCSEVLGGCPAWGLS